MQFLNNVNARGVGFIALLVLSFTIAAYFSFIARASGPTEEQVLSTEYWKSRIATVGDIHARDELRQQVGELQVYQQHIADHYFGVALYEEKGFDSIVVCDSYATYGCFHEIVRRYMDEYGAADLKALSSKCDDLLGEMSWMCKHAIGHGLILEKGRSIMGLRASLVACDSVSRLDEMENCHAGAFMEYDFDMSVPGDLDNFRPPEDDWFSPCHDIDPQYNDQCMRRRPYWWIIALPAQSLDERLAHMMSLCRAESMTESARHECVASIGVQIALLEGTGERGDALCTNIAKTNEEKETCENERKKALTILIPG